jgi:FlaA1/EpsC-like NDP-sugar epimerase
MNFIKKLVNWYFRRNSLPYWCIFILDGFILLFSGLVGFWMFSGWEKLIQHIDGVFYSLMIYVLLSIIGTRVFHTYSGIVRYSSFVDLQRVAYANTLSLALSVGVHYLLFNAPNPPFEPLHGRHLLVMY